MEGQKMGFFQKIYYSMAGFSYYKHFIRQKTGRAVVYLLLLSLALGIVGIIPAYITGNRMIDGFIKNFDRTVPDFTFESGKLDVKGNMPLIFQEGGTTFIIDTSGNADESVLDNYDNAILLTRDRMIQKNFANKQVTDFSLMNGLKIDKNSVKQMLPLIKVFIIIGMFFAIIFIVAGRFLSALIVSLPGLIINSVLNTRLRYADIFKISAYSLTLPLLLGTLIDIVALNIPYLWLITFLLFYTLSIVYIWGALRAVKNDMGIPPGSDL